MTICNCAACVRPGTLVKTSGCWPMRSGPSVNPVSASRRVVKKCLSRPSSSSPAGFCDVENTAAAGGCQSFIMLMCMVRVFFLLSGILTMYVIGESLFSTKFHHVDVYGAGLLPLIWHPDRVCYRREFVLN